MYKAVAEDGTLLYVGSGVLGRHKHCNSGTSNVYNLNKMHFAGEKIITSVVKLFDTKEESLTYEHEYILSHKPLFNIKLTIKDDAMYKGRIMSTVKRSLLEHIKEYAKEHNKSAITERLEKDLEEFFKIYRLGCFVEGATVQRKWLRKIFRWDDTTSVRFKVMSDYFTVNVTSRFVQLIPSIVEEHAKRLSEYQKFKRNPYEYMETSDL